MTEKYPDVIPMLAYEDGIAALEWLAEAFGFKERLRMTTDDGKLAHGEMQAGAGVIMLASPTPDYESSKRHRKTCASTRRWLEVPWVINGVVVYVDDLEAHFERARSWGAVILSPIESDPPGARYRAEDLEGHRWFFFQRNEETK